MSKPDLIRYELHRAASLDELCRLLDQRHRGGLETLLLAGGTDALVRIGQEPPAAGPLPLVVDVARLGELRGVGWDGRHLRMGASVTFAELARHHVVCTHAPLLARVCQDIGGPTIQARGTLGGNLGTASPAADGVAALAAYDAVVELESVRGRRLVPFGELQTGYKQSVRTPDEVIVAVRLAPPPAGSPWYWRKVGARRAVAISKVALAVVAELDAGRARRFGCAMASVAPVTALLPSVRRLVAETPIWAIGAPALARAVDADIAPIDDLRSTAGYRRHCAHALARTALRELGARV